MTDAELLKGFAATRSPDAFSQLVIRHAPTVYAAARRQLPDPSEADDITQAVFLVLVRRGAQLPGSVGLSSWLLKTTYLACCQARRTVARRRKHEQRAAAMRPNSAPAMELSELASILDAAMARLSDSDRSAILLRYLEQKSVDQVSQSLGVSSETAQKRISRAVARLRKLLGVGEPVLSSSCLAVFFATHGQCPVPQALLQQIANVPGTAAMAGISTGAVTVSKGVLKTMLWLKIQLIGAATLTTLAVGTTGTLVAQQALAPASAPVSAPVSAVEQARKALEADLEALRQKGEPARREDFIRPSVADAENAAMDLRAAAKSLEESNALIAYWEIAESLTTPLSRQQADVIRAMVKENAPALKLIKSAMAKGKVDWQNKYTVPMIEVRLPDLARLRMLASVLRPAALLAHEDGDDVAALEHVRELLFVGSVASDYPFSVCHLVETGIGATAFDVCREISSTLQLGKDPGMRDQLRRMIAELLDETELRAHLRRAIQGERVSPADTALALASGKLTMETLPVNAESKENFKALRLRPADAVLIALQDARTMVRELTMDVDAASAIDLPTALAKMKAWPPDEMERKKHFFTAMMLPSLKKAFVSHYTALAQRRLAATALAIRWYALDHDGQLPKALHDLTPAYLPAVPTDPMAVGSPLIYSPDDAAVYSVGIDGQDDGGDGGDDRGHPIDIAMRLK